jgi:hypothetical protein
MKKSTFIFMLVSKVILLLIFGIVGSKIAAFEAFSNGVVLAFAAICIAGLSSISYLKLTRTIETSNSHKKTSFKLGDRILKYFQNRTRPRDDIDSTLKKAFVISATGAFLVTMAMRYLVPSLLFLIFGLFLVSIVATLAILADPTTTRYQNLSDVVEEVISMLWMNGVFLAMPGMFAAFIVIWLSGGF